MNQVPQTEWLKQRKFVISSSGAQKSEIEVSSSSVPSVKKNLPHTSLLAPGCTVNLWPLLAYSCIAPIPAFIFMWCSPCVSVSVSKFPLFIRTPVLLAGAHPSDLILTGSSAKSLVPNEVTITDIRSDDLNIFGGDTIQPLFRR